VTDATGTEVTVEEEPQRMRTRLLRGVDAARASDRRTRSTEFAARRRDDPQRDDDQDRYSDRSQISHGTRLCERIQ
jgi:hypothetical protein